MIKQKIKMHIISGTKEKEKKRRRKIFVELKVVRSLFATDAAALIP